MSQTERQRATAGLMLFVGLSFLGSWFVAAALRIFGLTVAPSSLGTRLFTMSLLYAVSMGFQPIVATWIVRRWVDPPDRLDLGLRPSRPMFSVIGAASALAFAAAATLVAWGAARVGLASPRALHGSAEVAFSADTPSAASIVGLALAFAATLVLIWIQAFAEEVGWRGYFLPRAMERLGKWRGLVLHGAVWGLWYAPVLFFASYGKLDPFGSLGRSLSFVVTCMLLGTVFGWLRLASRSLAPVVIANSTLTLAAGLPYVVHGVDAGTRGAAFGPAGWVVLLLVIASLLLSRFRSVVQIPERLAAPPEPSTGMLGRVWLAVEGSRATRDRVLH